MAKKILVLFFHPRYENSIVNQSLVEAIRDLPGVTLHDLYEVYPDFDIDIQHEKELLLQHDIIVWQHPFYWYSCPPLMKQWIDLVLEYGWAYGRNGTQLTGKTIFNCISAGGSKEVYREGGRNRFSIGEFLRPFEQTAFLCHMEYWPPFMVHQANVSTSTMCQSYAQTYRNLLADLVEGNYDAAEISQREYLNIHQYSK